MLRRQRTSAVSGVDCQLMVTKFTAHDEGVFASIGTGCKELTWGVRVGSYCEDDVQDIEIKLQVDMTVIKTPKLRIEQTDSAGSTVLFPRDGKQRGILRDDFEYTWPFRGKMQEVGRMGMFEARVPGTETWYPAVVDGQRGDGKFDVTTFQPPLQTRLMDGLVSETFAQKRPVKHIAGEVYRGEYTDLRDVRTKQLVKTKDKEVTLHVPLTQKPLNDLYLTITEAAREHMVTHYFARPTPSPQQFAEAARVNAPPAKVTVKVDKYRKRVDCNIGHSRLIEYLAATPRIVEQRHERLYSQWIFMVGLARHTVRVEKKYRMSKVVTLLVDGEVLCEAAAKDIDHDDGEGEEASRTGSKSASMPWVCNFKLVGEVPIEFEVFKTNRDAKPIGDVTEKKLWRKEGGTSIDCRVALADHSDCRRATLTIDGHAWAELDEAREFHDEPNIMGLESYILEQQYGRSYNLRVPWAVDETADFGLSLLAHQAAGGVMPGRGGDSNGGGIASFLNIFGSCRQAANSDQLTVHGRQQRALC